MIEKWESDLYETLEEATAVAEDAAMTLNEDGYKIGEIRYENVVVEDVAGVPSHGGVQSWFYYGLPEDTLPGEEAERRKRTVALVIGGTGLALLVVTVVGLGIWGSKKR
jgi:hypothetical protein